MIDKHLFSVIIKLFMVITLLCPITSFIYGTNIVVVPTIINFDCESASNAHDALTISDSEGNAAAIPEWNSSVNQFVPLVLEITQNNTVAYVRGQTNPLIKVCFESNYKGFVHLLIKLSYVTGSTDGIGTICNLFIPNYNTNTSDFTTLNLTGTLPPSIGIHEFQWKWEIYAMPSIVDPNYCAATTILNTEHFYYTLLAAPLEPMASPWSGVLDLACKWTSGQTTDTSALDSLTTKLYNSGVTYGMGLYYTTLNDDSNLNLSDLLQDFKTPGSVNMDCRDFSNFLGVLSRSLGLSTESKKYGIQGTTNYLLPAGKQSYPVPVKVMWSFHRTVLYNDSIADAATQIDGDNNPANLPFKNTFASGHISESDYIKKLTPIQLPYIEDADVITVF